MKKLSSTLPNMLGSLVGICFVVAALLGFMYNVTKKPIEEAMIKDKNEAIKQVVPGFDNDPYKESSTIKLDGDKREVTIYKATKGGELIGFAIESYSDDGFAGYISEMVGFDTKGKLIDFKELVNNETPGLGTKIKEWFRSGKTSEESSAGFQSVKGLQMEPGKPLQVRKDGGTVDAITAATISSRAFTDAINRAYKAYEKAMKEQGGQK